MQRYVYIPIGMPCCGKTTFYNTMKELEEFTPVQVASPDLVREELYPGYEAGNILFGDIDQEQVFLQAHRNMEDLLLDGYNVWFDAINTPIKSRMVLFHRAEAIANTPFFYEEMNYILLMLHVPLEEILNRNETYRAGYRRPPTESLERMYEYFLSIAAEDLIFPIENRQEIWELKWDGVWSAVHVVPERCQLLLDNVNSLNN